MRLLALAALLLASPCFAQTGTMTLSWMPPTTNTDGSPLTNLAGYRVYWGTTQGSYPNSVTLTNPGLTGYILSGLTPAVWYSVVTAVNAVGTESVFSNVTSKTISGTPSSRVTIAGPVFNVLVTTNSLVLPQAGTVAEGQPCDPSQQVAFGGKVYLRVDVSSVTPFPGQQILAAFAECR